VRGNGAGEEGVVSQSVGRFELPVVRVARIQSGISDYPPSPLVHEHVVRSADENQVGQTGDSSELPRQDVMSLASMDVHSTSRESAVPVAHVEGGTLGLRRRAVDTSDAEHVTAVLDKVVRVDGRRRASGPAIGSCKVAKCCAVARVRNHLGDDDLGDIRITEKSLYGLVREGDWTRVARHQDLATAAGVEVGLLDDDAQVRRVAVAETEPDLGGVCHQMLHDLVEGLGPQARTRIATASRVSAVVAGGALVVPERSGSELLVDHRFEDRDEPCAGVDGEGALEDVVVTDPGAGERLLLERTQRSLCTPLRI